MKEPEELNRISVTADDISYAQRQNRWACAIVRSVQRSRPEATFVRADKEVIAFTERGRRYTYTTPQAAIDRVIKPLDLGQDIQPTTITLGIPQIRQAQRMPEEKKVELRRQKRTSAAIPKNHPGKQPGEGTRKHDRFCEE